MFNDELKNKKQVSRGSHLVMGGLFVCFCLMSSCCHNTDTPSDVKYLSEFNQKYFSSAEEGLQEDQLQLYVDCSTCNALGQNSNFYQLAMTPSFVSAAKKYFSIEGKQIIEHNVDSTYTLLRSIKEVNYADLKTATERIVNGNSEAVLVTDGEYYEPSIAAGNVSNPYMAHALKTWLLKGHDVYIVVEPYKEPYNGQTFDKKRFYFLFTDTRISNNIWNRVSQTGKLQDFPDVNIFHLAISRPFIETKQGYDSSIPNEMLAAKVQRSGVCEVQDWSVDWKPIEEFIQGAVDENTGVQLLNGEKVISGLSLDKNSFGALKINGITLKVYNINSAYNEFYNNKEERKPPVSSQNFEECPGFMIVDNLEFQKHSSINVYFDIYNYNPDLILDGSPFNYFKIDFYINDVKNVFAQYAKIFEFTSIDCQLGQTNLSIEKSVEQCLADPAIMNYMRKKPFYSIYVKSNQK